MTVHLEPVGADEVLLVEDRVVGAEEVEVLELEEELKLGTGSRQGQMLIRGAGNMAPWK